MSSSKVLLQLNWVGFSFYQSTLFTIGSSVFYMAHVSFSFSIHNSYWVWIAGVISGQIISMFREVKWRWRWRLLLSVLNDGAVCRGLGVVTTSFWFLRLQRASLLLLTPYTGALLSTLSWYTGLLQIFKLRTYPPHIQSFLLVNNFSCTNI